MTFDDFWEIKGGGCDYDIGERIWDAAQAAERGRANGLLVELKNILYAKPETWDDDMRDQFTEWARSRARAAIAKYEDEK